MGQRLLLIGGGHAHLATIRNIREIVSRGHRVTLINPSPFHDYSGMGPGLLSDRYRLSELRFGVAAMAHLRGAEFVEGEVTHIDAGNRTVTLATGEEFGFDVVSFNTGSRVSVPLPHGSAKHIFPVKPVGGLFLARQEILARARETQDTLKILVVGGGPAGCEVTGNLQQLCRDNDIRAELTLLDANRLLDRLPERARERALGNLLDRPLHVIEGIRMTELKKHSALLEEGRTLGFDFAFVATGISPGELFSRSGLATGPDGGLQVNQYLQAIDHPRIFGGGDCISFQPSPLDRVGVYAVSQAPILLHNLMAALEHRPMRPFRPQKRYLLILNLGAGRGMATRNGLALTGRGTIWLKNVLDRMFMRRYQDGIN